MGGEADERDQGVAGLAVPARLVPDERAGYVLRIPEQQPVDEDEALAVQPHFLDQGRGYQPERRALAPAAEGNLAGFLDRQTTQILHNAVLLLGEVAVYELGSRPL